MTLLIKIFCFTVFFAGLWALIVSLNIWREFGRREAEGCITISLVMLTVPALIMGVLLLIDYLEETIPEILLKTVFYTIVMSGIGTFIWGLAVIREGKTSEEKNKGKRLALIGGAMALGSMLIVWLLQTRSPSHIQIF